MRKRSWRRPPRTLRATRAGWCFIAIILGVGFGALNTGNNLLYLVLALLLAFLVLSGLLSEGSLRGIRIERSLPREIFAGSPNRVVLRVHNDQRHNASFAITIEDRLEVETRLEAAGRIFILRIGARSFEHRSYLFEPRRRGDIQFDGFRVSTRFPFGLFVKSRELDLPECEVVYPCVRRVPLQARNARSSAEDEEPLGASNHGHEIAGLREFEPGDSLARVHWRSSARAGKLLVGEREDAAEAVYEIRLDLPAHTSEQRVEDRVAQAASEVVTQLETGACVGLRTKTIRFPAAAGFPHRSTLLRFLARVQPDSTPTPEPAARKSAR